MTGHVADPHAHVNRLVSVVKMVTMLRACSAEEQRSVCTFLYGQKDSMQKLYEYIKKCFLFTVGSVCRVKWFTTGLHMLRWWRSGWNGDEKVTETTLKTLLCFDALVKWWDKCISVEKYMFFQGFKYYMNCVLYSFVACLLTLPRTILWQ
jgi:hypothetical protein